MGMKLYSVRGCDRYLNSLYNRKKLAHNTKVGYNVTVNTLKQYKQVIWRLEKIRPEHCEELACGYERKSIEVHLSDTN